MATAEQLKSLIRSHFSNDRERFATIALQLAAHEAKLGHSTLAHEIRALVDKAKSAPVRVVRFNRELDDLVISSEPKERLADLIVSDDMRNRIKRILREYRQQEKLKKHGLCNRRKALLAGHPGTGKTMTAAVLAGELHLPLHTILMDKLVTKFMGETSAKLRQIFDVIRERRGVYLFDEFDAIGAERGRDNDVGEMRRVLNAFLQFIEQDKSDSLIVAATNNPRILDQALFRRFDDVLYYHLPTTDEIQQLMENRLGGFRGKKLSLKTAVKEADTLSHAEITQACDDAIKEAILADRKTVTATLLKRMLRERRLAYGNAQR
jgi:SpoVK/Ycf46/Vps4 family AAA+-type ATPase